MEVFDVTTAVKTESPTPNLTYFALTGPRDEAELRRLAFLPRMNGASTIA